MKNFIKIEKLDNNDKIVTKTIVLDDLICHKIKSLSRLFEEDRSLISIDCHIDSRSLEDISSFLSSCRNLERASLDINLSNVYDIRMFFDFCEKLRSLDISKWDTSNIENMGALFDSCIELSDIDLSNFNTSNVTLANGMFYRCKSLKILDLRSFDFQLMTHVNVMFRLCENVELIRLPDTLNTSNVEWMDNIFSDCLKLKTIENIEKFDTRGVISMYRAFYNCKSLKSLDLSKWVISNQVTITDLFTGCDSLISVKLGSRSLNLLKTTKIPPSVVFYVPPRLLEKARSEEYNRNNLPMERIQPYAD